MQWKKLVIGSSPVDCHSRRINSRRKRIMLLIGHRERKTLMVQITNDYNSGIQNNVFQHTMQRSLLLLDLRSRVLSHELTASHRQHFLTRSVADPPQCNEKHSNTASYVYSSASLTARCGYAISRGVYVTWMHSETIQSNNGDLIMATWISWPILGPIITT